MVDLKIEDLRTHSQLITIKNRYTHNKTKKLIQLTDYLQAIFRNRAHVCIWMWKSQSQKEYDVDYDRQNPIIETKQSILH